MRKEVVVEITQTITKPKVEIRKPATLAQALSEPGTVVVKPETRSTREIRKATRRAS